MIRTAAASLVLAAAMAGTAAAAIPLMPPSLSALTLQAEGDFCSGKPDALDTRIATAVDSLPVSAPSTAPIAILDTGVSADVPELAGRLVTPFDAATAAQDGNDVDGHGTEVAGIAAGALGLVQGVSPTSPIMPVRVYNLAGEVTVPWLIGGISWAVQNGASVINISSALPEADASAADIAALTRATSDAFNKGVLVIASAGNDGGTAPQLPAALPHVLAVGASDLAGNRATFSDQGPWVDLVSPATSMVAPISTAYCQSGYAVANGTSFAAPAVAGAAALLAQARPSLTIQQRFDLLRTSAHDEGAPGRDDDTGFGLLDVANALNAPAPAAAESSREVDDDPYYVRGPNAAGHPLLLTRTRKVRLAGQLSPAKDPSDVYPVRLRKGERLVVSGKVAGADSLISLGLWDPSVGDFDVTNEVPKHQIVSSGGFSTTPALKMKAKRSGTYYVSVEAADVDTEDPSAITPSAEAYQLLITKSPPVKKSKKKTSRKKTKKKKG